MKITIASTQPDNLERLVNLLADPNRPTRTVKSRLCGIDGVSALVAQELPDLVIIDQLCKTSEDIIRLEPIAKRFPGISFILLGDSMVAETLMHAMHVGVKDVLPTPYPDERFLAAVERIEETRTIGAAQPIRATVATFLSCKGGGGSTFVAANVAYMLAAAYGKKTLLIDLDIYSGDASLFVTKVPGTTTISDISANIARLDSDLLSAIALHITDKFDVLQASDTLELGLDIRPDHIDLLLNLASNTYEFIIINLGRTFDKVSVRAIDRSDSVYATVQQTIPFLRDAKRVLGTLAALGCDSQKTRLIVNRYEHSSEMTLEDVERTLGHSADCIIPNDYRTVSNSINRGIPVYVSHPRSVICRRLTRLIETTMSLTTPAEKGWLTRLLSHA